MRKLAVAGSVLVVVLGATGAALASSTFPTVKLTPKVSSTKAGTPSHPKGVTLTTLINWQKLGAANQPVVTKFLVWFPQGSQYNGGKVTSCSHSKVVKGPSKCPKASIMGSGTGTAYADTSETHPKITVINGGAKTIWFYTVLNNPARVREPVQGTVKKLSSGPYSYQLTVTVPKNLQIVAGVPIELTQLKVVAGKGTWLATTGCPGGQWPFKITTDYQNPNNGDTGSASDSSSLHCT
jgi:hypothetical protein